MATVRNPRAAGRVGRTAAGTAAIVLVVTVEVDGLVKCYRVHRRRAGLRAALGGLFRREYTEVRAVDGVGFSIAAGQIVGFLGPNGAGKTTTLKCLAGLLHPTAGTVRVLGHTPHQRERDFLRQVSLVMGQRNSLFWDLPALDAFEVNRVIYGIAPARYAAALAELVELLELEPLLTKQIRVLSLGERMRCELAGALLHEPRVLFLDEPTLGLDVTAQAAVRGFLRDYNASRGATVLLTSHYMGDVTALASRVLVIDHGRLRFDGDLSALARAHVTHRIVRLRLARPVPAAALAGYGEVVGTDGPALTLRVPATDTATVAARLLVAFDVVDVAIEDPPIEDVIRAVFAGG